MDMNHVLIVEDDTEIREGTLPKTDPSSLSTNTSG